MGRIDEMEPYETDPDDAVRAEAAVEQAERELSQEARVKMRWPSAQLDVVRRAAELFGMPYQIYIRQATFRAVLDDLQKVQDFSERESHEQPRRRAAG